MRRFLVAIVTCLALLAACSSGGSSSGSTDTTTGLGNDDRGGIPEGYPTDHDVAAPLAMSAIGPAPIPVTGTDDRVHLVYELEILNPSPRPAIIRSIETLAGGADGPVVGSVDLTENMWLAGDAAQTPTTEIPSGRTALVLVDDSFERTDEVPDRVIHRIVADLGPATPGFEEVGASYDDTVRQIGGPVAVSSASPVVVGPPLAGSDWAAINACCGASRHRLALLPMAGRINATERYAIDWVKFDLTADPLFDLERGLMPTFSGDPSSNESYFAYGEPLLAVADGTVVTVIDDRPEATPQSVPTGLAMDELGGNLVVIDIGGGNYAFYAHLIPGSATVEVGDRVTRGQVIGRLGNSGSSSEPHLHFQVMRAPAPLSSDNVPFVIDRFLYAGQVPLTGFEPATTGRERTDQLPLLLSVVDFPARP